MLKHSWLAGAALLGTVGCAAAADMPLFSQPEEEVEPAQLEFGTGWYLRGDLAASNIDELRYSPSFLGSLGSATALASAVAKPGPDITSTRTDWDFAAGLGAGYRFNSWLRADVTGDYLGADRFNGTVAAAPNAFGVVGKGQVRRFDGLVNAYVDLGTWWGLQPYIGAGVGVAAFQTSVTEPYALTYNSGSALYESPTVVPKGRHTQYDLAWAGMAGVSYPISQHLMLDIGYRYLDLGRYTVPVIGEKKTIVDQQARVGVRYEID